MTPTGQVPIPGAVVYCEHCGEITHTWATAGAKGCYRVLGDRATGGRVWPSPGKPSSIIVEGTSFEQQTGLSETLTCPLPAIPASTSTSFDAELARSSCGCESVSAVQNPRLRA